VRIVLDLNVVLDVLLAREKFLDSAEVLLFASERKIEAFIPLHGVTTIYYFCRKEMKDASARLQLLKLLEAAEVFSISDEEVRRAIVSPMDDFEDAIVAETARAANAEFIITRDTADFRDSAIPALTPTEFIERFFRVA
jgi:predicted nucleic acid-binding protein